MCLALAVVLSVFASIDDRWPGDLALTEAAQDLPRWLDDPVDAVRALTGTEVVLVTGAVAALGLWLIGLRAEAVALAAALVVLPFLQANIKDIVDRPRPDPDLVEYRGAAGSPSFPSGHVMSGTVLYGWLAVTAARQVGAWWQAAAVALALLVVAGGFANVYEGVHWPSDVLGGYVWAAVLLVAAAALQLWIAAPGRPWSQWFRPRGRVRA